MRRSKLLMISLSQGMMISQSFFGKVERAGMASSPPFS
jgi:hypothetical protein